ncbi:mitochondrial 54S ribosomal protein YmL23 [Pseudovirgaria hyperparasitica]|uniref:Large ribosomal subunit protein uL13m n=1 Tax=Pseudovirgaria hyperparasitica TaxID=470096 RepID=A0A6A6WH26_9PEZI|nr:mitochondrial 54S ribosomal protein YmL23 [Pseudovirgaria hyperparasitica]KAF2761384.1 mitochondrial 54S ribosomal protein YmL23 [Pseudovirgaria hyperparasitica]
MSQTIGKTRLAYNRAWHVIDVGTDTRPLGRIATQIALVLMGKHKPIYDPSTDCGDYVVAVGCHDLHTTGKKREKKMYYTHNTRPGSLKSISMDGLFKKWGGSEVLIKAVSGMLPKNRLRKPRLARLKAFEGNAHPYKKNILRLGHPGARPAGEPTLRPTSIIAELAVEAQAAKAGKSQGTSS